MGRSKTDILQGMLDMLVLKTLADEPLHGYGIAQRLRSLSDDRLQVPQGSLYPAVHRLENRGFVRGEWAASPTGREAKYYRLTAKGRRELESQVEAWRDLSLVIGAVLGPS
ncbi:MAG: PadR family transcriptional regulator [Gemmatimonadales bacterium]